jgi:pyridoxamine 5'-phosphate oxidase
MTLSTTDAAGHPDARVLILKDVGGDRWWFATSARSVKGSQLTHTPAAALTFYWPTVSRQIRVRGPVVKGPPELGAADFRARSAGARAVALASHESQPLSNRATCAEAVAVARERLRKQPDLLSSDWQVYFLTAESVEFWQADRDRQHVRVHYRRGAQGWAHTLLWP